MYMKYSGGQKKQMSVDICFKLIKVVCQGETLCRQRVPKGSSSRKKTIPIKVLLEPWHINNKIMQGMRISGRPYSFMRQGY